MQFYTLAVVAALLVAGVCPAQSAAGDWTERDLGEFSFKAPSSLNGGPKRGIDSFVGSYDSDLFGLSFDYGAYSGHRFQDGDAKDSRFVKPASIERLTIDGRDAWIMTGERDGTNHCEVEVALAVEAVAPSVNLGMTSCGDRDSVSTVREIYRSIRFKAP